MSAVSNSINNTAGKYWVVKDFIPSIECKISGNNDGRLLQAALP